MQVTVAYAALLDAQLNVERTTVRAPTSGTIVNFTLRPGAMVNAGDNLFAIVDMARPWVTANYKETDLAHIQVGQRAVITLDMYPQHPFAGTVAQISHGSGSSFSLLPAENATGNWVKVTQRFPVKMWIDPSSLSADYPLRVGATATVRVLSKP